MHLLLMCAWRLVNHDLSLGVNFCPWCLLSVQWWKHWWCASSRCTVTNASCMCVHLYALYAVGVTSRHSPSSWLRKSKITCVLAFTSSFRWYKEAPARAMPVLSRALSVRVPCLSPLRPQHQSREHLLSFTQRSSNYASCALPRIDA